MRRFPDWLKKSIPQVSTLRTEAILQRYGLNTICHSAKCPNRSECFAGRTATFLILGNLCTRRCTFCSVPQGIPSGWDPTEPERVALASNELGLKHVVITSVTRDDLPDEGAQAFFETILAVKKWIPGVKVEVLTPDFRGKQDAILKVAEAGPDIYNHNLETIPRLYRRVRPGALYERSLNLIRAVKTRHPDIVTKSGLMVGLGETPDEVLNVLRDLRDYGCDVVTIGQYLTPEEGKLAVQEYVSPAVFGLYETQGKELGFREVFSGPFVRSSYHAEETFSRAKASSVCSSVYL
jgi:lipoic acid synthetase